MNDLGIYNKDNFKRYLQWAIRGFTQLNLYSLESFNVAYLTMDEVGRVTLPDDFIDYTKIGICKSGKIYTLGLNDDLCMSRSEECGVPLNDSFNAADDTLPAGYYFVSHFRGDNYIPALYGLTGGFAESYYRVDRKRGEIQFSSSVARSEIILEYLSSGVSLTGSTYIPRQAQEALIAFVHYKRVEFDPVSPMNLKQFHKQEFDEEFNKLNSFEHMPTAQEIMDALYKGYKATPKR
jgi:hypothetical protein